MKLFTLQLLDGVHVRESSRARRMALYAEAPDRIELVVPRGTSRARIAAFALRHASWIEGARAELGSLYRGDVSAVPENIVLPAVGRSWRLRMGAAGAELIEESAGGGPSAKFALPPALLGQPTTGELHAGLRRWLVTQGRRLLPARVLTESERLSLRPSRIQVRLQRSRWGSCSAARTISLNARALFLDPEVLRYLIVHELCHLAHMSHSHAYWRCVERYEPEYRRLDAELGGAWAVVPRWAYPS